MGLYKFAENTLYYLGCGGWTVFASRARTRRLSSLYRCGGSAESRNLSPLGEAFGAVCGCRAMVRFVVNSVVLGRSIYGRMNSGCRNFLRSYIGIGVWRVVFRGFWMWLCHWNLRFRLLLRSYVFVTNLN